MSLPPVASITVDLDSAYQYRHIHGLPQVGRGDDTPLTLGVERLLDLFAAHAIPATLFVVGADSQRPAHRALLETCGAVESAVDDYMVFLSAMRHTDALEPSAMVDLVWHTHLQMPDRYHKDCVRIAGRLIDHDDTPEHTFSSVGG